MDHASKEFLKIYSLLLENRDAATEQRILKSRVDYQAYYYAKEVIKGRWPEAEEFIKKDNYLWNWYTLLICKECNGEGVIDLGIGGAEEECSTCFGKGFDPSKLND